MLKSQIMSKILFIALIFLFLIWSFFIEPNLIVIKNYKFKIPQAEGMKIVFVSDFHIAKQDKKRLRRIVKKINKQNPDVVLSCGDYIKGYSGRNTLDIISQTEELKKIKAPFITILGNHDGHFDKENIAKTLKNAGFTVLNNSNIKFKNLYIAGLDDIQTGSPDSNKALNGTKSPRIILTHSPDTYYDIKDNVDLILAGHTHGGQVSLPFIGALVVPSDYGVKFAKGIIKETQNTMLITKGLGTSILSLRFLTIPEIVVIDVE